MCKGLVPDNEIRLLWWWIDFLNSPEPLNGLFIGGIWVLFHNLVFLSIIFINQVLESLESKRTRLEIFLFNQSNLKTEFFLA